MNPKTMSTPSGDLNKPQQNQPKTSSDPIVSSASIASTASRPFIPAPPAKKKVWPKILACIVGVIVLAICCFAVYIIFFSQSSMEPTPKTVAQFEQIMSKNGYEKATKEELEYKGQDGSYVTYVKGKGDGIIMFYDVSSREHLHNLVKENILDTGDESSELFEDFDWSANYNKSGGCNENKAHVHICMNVVQIKNTMLMTFFHSDSKDEAISWTNEVLSLTGYNY